MKTKALLTALIVSVMAPLGAQADGPATLQAALAADKIGAGLDG